MEKTEMLFSEIYGKYYSAVAAILRAAVSGTLTEVEITRIVRDKAFVESTLRIPAALKTEEWPLIDFSLRTPLAHEPGTPLSLLEKRWMKALLTDPRIRLFDPPPLGLDGVAPLFEPGIFVWYDRYTDGDPYEDETYVKHFRTVLTALREKRKIRICFRSHRGVEHEWECIPYRLEYSPKDDKFRVQTKSPRGNGLTVNVARVINCELLEPYEDSEYSPPTAREKSLIMELVDERNALERAMLHFSHLKREAERIGENRYKITIYYEREDETEILIRFLSFGPKLIVTGPERFVSLVRERVQRQMELSRI